VLYRRPLFANPSSLDTFVFLLLILCELFFLPQRLKDVLTQLEPNYDSRMLIFSQTKRGCDSLSRTLNQLNWRALAIHGDKSQQERDSVLAQFRSGRIAIMVATDVAARGLDVKNITTVVNYDFPSCCEDYVHRIGRTGRAGAKGTSYSFFTQTNANQGKALIKILEKNGQVVPPALRSMSYSARTKFFFLTIISIIKYIFQEVRIVTTVGIEATEEVADLEIVGIEQVLMAGPLIPILLTVKIVTNHPLMLLQLLMGYHHHKTGTLREEAHGEEVQQEITPTSHTNYPLLLPTTIFPHCIRSKH